MDLNSILGMLSFYVGDLHSNGEGEIDTACCVNGYFPILTTKTNAIHLLSETSRFYNGFLEDADNIFGISKEEKKAIQQRATKLVISLEELSSCSSFFVVIGGKNEAFGSICPTECFVLIDKLDSVDFSDAVKEWLNKYHSSLGDRQNRIIAMLEQIDAEFDRNVENVAKILSSYYEKYYESDPKGEHKFHFYVKVPYALERLKATLNYYQLDDVKSEIKPNEHQEIVSGLERDIESLEKTHAKYCVIRDAFDFVFPENEVAELIFIDNAPSLYGFISYLNDFHGETACATQIERVASNFANRRIYQICAEVLISK